MESVFKYCADLWVAAVRGHVTTSVLVICWFAWPTAVKTILYPTQAIGLGYYLHHQIVPRFYTVEQVSEGEIKAIAALVILALITFLVTVLFYRQATYSVTLWPVAAVIIGILYTGAWWLHSGFFDEKGALAFGSTVVLAGLCEALCEKFGKDAAFGKNVRPQRA